MRRISLLFVVLLLLISLISGCIGRATNDALVVCGTLAIPGFAVRDMKGGTYRCSILEKDSQGRILYAFSAENYVSGCWDTVYIICQEYDRKYVYFYEDRCYSQSSHQSDLLTLKEINDWDKPLDFNAMSRREIAVSYDSYIMLQPALKTMDVIAACKKAAEVDRIRITDIQFIDADGYGHEMYFFTVDNEQKAFWAITDEALNICLFEITENQINTESFIAFKQASGWKRGF